MMALRIATLLTVAMLQQGWDGMTDLPITGSMTFYGPGIMEQVAENRRMELCDGCVGFAAMASKKDIGRRVFVRTSDGVYGPFLVADCAATEDFAAFTASGHVIEVSYEWGQRLGMRGPIPVLVFDKPAYCRERAMAQ